MSFLEPWLLLGLPLISLPIIIHLINQRRFQTVRWGAMMFLLSANRMARGYARIRQWLIMAFRMAAIAGLIFAISRPLASGWLGLVAGGRPDTTIILLDRSPSMQQSGDRGGDSKLTTGRQQLVQTLNMVGSAHWVLIENTTNKPRALDTPEALLTSPATGGTSAASDLPALLEAAASYIRANKAGRTDIWICSDLRRNDWDPESGRWAAVRQAFLGLRQGIRFHLLAFPELAAGNIAVEVSDVRRQQNGSAAELVLSLRLVREGPEAGRVSVPVHFEIDGARSELTVEMENNQYELKDYRIPLESRHERGWGKVTIAADANPADNDFYFAFERPAVRRAVIVADDALVAAPLQLAAAISPDTALPTAAEVLSADRLATLDWEKISLLIWQSPLPEGDLAQRVREFVDRGGYAIFLPPQVPGPHELFGVRWTSWTENTPKDAHGSEAAAESWRGDQDLLARTQSGATLPVGQVQIRRSCGLKGQFTPLATLRGGSPLLARCAGKEGAGAGAAYFLATTPAVGDSSLASNGVVLYVLVQRALAGGAAALGNVRQVAAGSESVGQAASLPVRPLPAGSTARPQMDNHWQAGSLPHEIAAWQRVAGPEDVLSSEYAFQRGVYMVGDRMIAVNRPLAEDRAPILDDAEVAGLFRGLNFIRVDRQAGRMGSLIQEIWKPFLASMIVALLVEAGLCFPRKASPTGKAA